MAVVLKLVQDRKLRITAKSLALFGQRVTREMGIKSGQAYRLRFEIKHASEKKAVRQALLLQDEVMYLV